VVTANERIRFCSLLSLAIAAQTHNLVKPILSQENLLLIEDGRHLVQEMSTIAIAVVIPFECAERFFAV
jgi:DNA mismatch repair ATPase MutS